MTRWLQAARGIQPPETKPTELTKPNAHHQTGEVLSVKSVLSDGAKPDSARLALILDHWEERAAIREYEARQSRDDAEADAAREVGLPLRLLREVAREARPP